MLSPTPNPVRARSSSLIFGDERIGADELWERVGRLAGGLAARGVGPGDRVALLLPNGPAFATTFLAIAQLGAVVVPLNPQFKRAELEFCYRDADVQLVIDDEQEVARLIEEHAARAPEPRSPDEEALLAYSAGCTGHPKRVPRTAGQLWWEADTRRRHDGADAGRHDLLLDPDVPRLRAGVLLPRRPVQRRRPRDRRPAQAARARPRGGPAADRARAGDRVPGGAVRVPRPRRGWYRRPTSRRSGCASRPATRCRARPSTRSTARSASRSGSSTA